MLLGAPGAGKGTYSNILAKRFGLPIVGTGDMIRAVIASGSDAGKRLAAYSDRGELVPDALVLELLEERLGRPDTANGFILDGFPRTVSQAEVLRRFAPLHLVVNIVLPDKHVIAKLLGRVGCSQCGGNYNVADVHDVEAGVYMPPMLPPGWVASELQCERGSVLTSRSDDTEDVISARLATYHKKTAPLIEYYRAQGILVDYRVQTGTGDMPHLESALRKLLPSA